ncbi:MAG: acyl carrier protein [Actinomycetota bacterium]|jgi:acyl carrier protein|nr:acyl carrier protein [Actinomycetota bacterium]
MNEQIRQILAEQAGLAVPVETLGDDDDLFAAGLTSFGVVNVMLALEDALDVELPEHLLRKSTFQSVSALATVLGGLAPTMAP